ncbi:hypothetical protein ACFXO5_23765, partial [Bacillus subtilis]
MVAAQLIWDLVEFPGAPSSAGDSAAGEFGPDGGDDVGEGGGDRGGEAGAEVEAVSFDGDDDEFGGDAAEGTAQGEGCLLYTNPSPR